MNEEKLLDAVSGIEEQLILEADTVRKKKKIVFLKPLGIIAACFLLSAVSLLALIPLFGIFKSNITSESSSTSKTPEDASTGQIDKENASVDINSPLYDQDTHPPAASESANLLADESVYTVPLFVTINSVTENGYICTVNDPMGNEDFKKSDTVTVYVHENTDVDEDTILPGDSVYIIFSNSRCEEKNSIFAHKIYTEEGETTPAFY